MNDDQPTQPLTNERLAEIRNHVDHQLKVDRSVSTIASHNLAEAVDERAILLDEVNRLRTENDAHVRHLADIRRTLSKAGAHGQPEASGVRQLARCAESLREGNERLEDELETVTEENSALLRKLEEQYRHRAQSANEVTRLRAELAQTESGASIAMDAGVTALQEVKRLEKVCADLKEINDRMAVDRLRLVDERDRLIAEREADADVSSDKALGWGSGH